MRLIVFDLDGTLVDSLRDLADAVNVLLGACGGAPHSEQAIGRMVGDGAATLVRRAFEAAGVPMPADALPRFLAIYDTRLLRFTRPYPGIVDLLETLHARIPLAVLTNKPRRATGEILDGLGLSGFFGERVLGGDGPLARKPDPGGLHQLMRNSTVDAPDTLMVGDSHVDCLTARAAGTRFCGARYGFGFTAFPAAALTPDDMVIDQPTDLLGYL